MPVPKEDETLVQITRAKMQLLQAKWADAGGPGELYGAWQVKNKRLDRLFRATAHNLMDDLGRVSDTIDGWHGTAEANVLSIARNGFDPGRRCGQVYGAGEYFAKDPKVSIGYSKGGSFMFLCKLLLGAEDADHTWVDSSKYYVVKQRDGLYQALPVYLVQFGRSESTLVTRLNQLRTHELEDEGVLRFRQRGGQSACEARKDAGMTAASTSYLWVGWLAPELCSQGDDAIFDDVRDFLQGFDVAEVIPERNGARVGAFVRLSAPLQKAGYTGVASRLYRGTFRISVDDAQPSNPRCSRKRCPRLMGPSKYCRGWNIRGHDAWQWGCPFSHPPEMRPTHRTSYVLEDVAPRTAKYDEIETALMQSAPFHNGWPKLVGVKRIINHELEEMYEKRRNFLSQKHGFALEKDLWHGTTCKALPDLLTHGLQPPSDSMPSDDCPVSGGKGLTTTLCGTECHHCTRPHVWCKCHMYGYGVYLADLAQKSHRYARDPEMRQVGGRQLTCGVGARILGGDWQCWGTVVADEGAVWRLSDGRIAKKENEGVKWWWDTESGPETVVRGVGGTICGMSGEVWGRVVGDDGLVWNLESGRIAKKENEDLKWYFDASASGQPAPVYSMLWCRVVLGSPYLIEGNLLSPAGMHSVCWCQDPTDQLETVAEDWNVAQGHDCYYVRGLSGAQRAGLGVYNSEYIVFQPYQVLPMYLVEYTIS